MTHEEGQSPDTPVPDLDETEFDDDMAEFRERADYAAAWDGR